jgi:hypothetical protein
MPGLAVAKGGEVELFLLLEPPDGGGLVWGQLPWTCSRSNHPADWGIAGPSEEDCEWSPGQVIVRAPAEGRYRIAVGSSCDGGATGTVRIFCRGSLVRDLGPAALGPAELLHIGSVEWPACTTHSAAGSFVSPACDGGT